MNEDLPHEILNAQQREALRLWDEARLTYPQIAERKGLSEGRIQQVLVVARARFSEARFMGCSGKMQSGGIPDGKLNDPASSLK